MIYREVINGHIYVNRVHFIASCPACRAQLAKIEEKESRNVGQHKG